MSEKKIDDAFLHEHWTRPVVRIGMITMLSACILSFLPLVYLYIVYGVYPKLSTAITAWGLIAAVFGAMYFVEPISYYPILGLAGTYMSILSGNVSNLRLPCSAMAQEVLGVKEGTRQAELIGHNGNYRLDHRKIRCGNPCSLCGLFVDQVVSHQPWPMPLEVILPLQYLVRYSASFRYDSQSWHLLHWRFP